MKKSKSVKEKKGKLFEKSFSDTLFKNFSGKQNFLGKKFFYSENGLQKGFFLVIEGIDGAGTTTQVNALYNWLKSRKIPCIKTREPSPGVIGRHIKKLLKQKNNNPIELALLFAVDRIDHFGKIIIPALSYGMWVISDRYRLSSLAYQSLDCDSEWVAQINRYAPPPNLTILLDIPVETALQRVEKRANRREFFERKSKLKKVRNNYLNLASRREEGRIIILNGTQSKKVLTGEIIKVLQSLSLLKET